MEAIVGGIIFTIFSGVFFLIWFFTHKKRESDPTVRMSQNRTLILSLIGITIGVSMIIVGAFS